MVRVIPTSKRGKAVVFAGVAFALYLIIGFLLLPPLVRTKLESAIGQATQRTVKIERVAINPLALSVSVQGFQMLEPSGDIFVAFNELYVNYNALALFGGAVGFDNIALRSLFVRVAIDETGKYNFSDLIPAGEKDEAPQEKSAPPTVNVTAFRLENGTVLFSDTSHAQPFTAEFKTLSFGLDNFTTKPDREGRYSLEAVTANNERLRWNGEVSVSPLRSRGSLDLADLRLQPLGPYLESIIPVQIKQGLVDASTEYDVAFAPDQRTILFEHGRVRVHELDLVSPNDGASIFSLDNITVSEIRVDAVQHTVDVGAISGNTGKIHLARDAGGKLNVMTLAPPASEAAPATTPPATAAPTTPPWSVKIADAQLRNWGMHLDDQSTTPPAALSLSPINIEAKHIDVTGSAPLALQFDIGVNGTGKLSGQGDIALHPLDQTLQLRMDALDLMPFQPYIAQFTRLKLASGAIDAQAKVVARQANDQLALDIRASATLKKFRGIDPVLNEDLVRLADLSVKDLHYTSSPAALNITEIELGTPYLRMIIGADGTTNLQHIKLPPAATDAAAAQAPKQESASPPLAIKVGVVNIRDASINFADHSLSPNFDVGIQSLQGKIAGLSSKEIARASVTLDGHVDKYAPATIRGEINPLSENTFSDVVVALHGLEMTTFTPYSAKFAGHKIDKGKLNVDLHYLLSKNVLKGENKVVVDQLELGEKVESADAVGLPVRLAVALLKDANGVIDVDLPIGGNLDDPEFHYGKFVWQAIKNLIVKLATAPFRALMGGTSGTEEGLDRVRFAVNDAHVTPAEQEKLLKLTDALNKRPTLRLEIRGTAGEADRAAMVAALVAAQAKMQSATTAEKSMPPSGTSATPAPPAPTPTVPDEQLRDLAQARAAAVLDFLVQSGNLNPQRVFVLEVDTHAAGEQFVDALMSVQVP